MGNDPAIRSVELWFRRAGSFPPPPDVRVLVTRKGCEPAMLVCDSLCMSWYEEDDWINPMRRVYVGSVLDDDQYALLNPVRFIRDNPTEQ